MNPLTFIAAMALQDVAVVVCQGLVRSLYEVRGGLASLKLGMPHSGNLWRGFVATGCYGHRALAVFHERGEAPEG